MTTQPQKPLFHSYAVEALQKANIDDLTILERITDGFVLLDKAWRCVYVNPQAEQMLAGTTREALLEKPLWEVLPQAKDSIFEQKCRFQHKRVRGLSLKGEKCNRSKRAIFLHMLGISTVFQSNRKLCWSHMDSNTSACAD